MKIQSFCFPLVAVIAGLFFSIEGYSSTVDSSPQQLTLSFYNDDAPVHFIVVEKSQQRLMVFKQQQTLKLLRTFVCATGEVPGKKTISGDSKTPEGMYFITEIYEDKKITVFGSRAYHLDYPNVFDQQAGHLGDGIFIHGTNKKLVPFSTNGCIVLANDDLDQLAAYLTVSTVPIIVVENLATPLLGTDLRISRNDSKFAEIIQELSFIPRYFSTDNIKSVSFLTLDSQAIALITYRTFDEGSVEYQYHKRVYLTTTPTNNWRTIYSLESQDFIPTILAQHPVKDVFQEQAPLPPEPAVEPTGTDDELLAFINKWQTAWSTKDIDSYIECYSPSFKRGSLDLNGWRKKKSYLNEKYAFIKIDIRNIVVDRTMAGANVSFFLEYRSDLYHTSGTKHLQLINQENKWMIQKEEM